MKNLNIKKHFIKIFFFILIIYIDFIILNSINKYYYNKKLLWNNEEININKIQDEIFEYENLTKCKYKIDNFNIINPKISLIVPVFNQEKYLIPFYCSLNNQSFKNIEIIFIDDASTDNSSKIIKEFKKRDKRIKYLKNKNNKRTFFSRKKGILKAKGEYVLVVDPDDLIINDILKKSYNTAINYNIDILQFYIIYGNYTNNKLWSKLKCRSGIIRYPRVKDLFYHCKTRNLCDKLIKRNVFIDSIKYMGSQYDYDRFEFNDDDVAIYGLAILNYIISINYKNHKKISRI